MFEALVSNSDRSLSVKTAMLIALISAERAGELTSQLTPVFNYSEVTVMGFLACVRKKFRLHHCKPFISSSGVLYVKGPAIPTQLADEVIGCWPIGYVPL